MTGPETLRLGGLDLPLEVSFGDRRTLGISVTPDLRVLVRAPSGVEWAAIDAKLRRRAGWVLHQVRHFERFHPLPTPRQFISGESHLYLGRQYRLKVRRGRGEVKLLAGRFDIRVPFPASGREVETALYGWYQERAEAVFTRRLDRIRRELPVLREGDGDFRIRRMRTRWGSCTAAGRLLLNVELVKAPLSCIDYVLVHELAHRLVPSHGPRFRTLLARCMPDWRERWERLNRVPV